MGFLSHADHVFQPAVLQAFLTNRHSLLNQWLCLKKVRLLSSANYYFNSFTLFLYHHIVSGVMHVCPDGQPQRLQIIALAETTGEQEMEGVDSALNPAAAELCGGMQRLKHVACHSISMCGYKRLFFFFQGAQQAAPRFSAVPPLRMRRPKTVCFLSPRWIH